MYIHPTPYLKSNATNHSNRVILNQPSMSSNVSDRRIMRVRWFDRRKGYGFLVPVNQALESDTQEDTVFVYHNQLKTFYMDNIFRMLYSGEYVECSLSKDDRDRTVAQNVTGVQDGPLMCEVRAMNAQNQDEEEDEGRQDRRRGERGERGVGRGRGRGRGGHRGPAAGSMDA